MSAHLAARRRNLAAKGRPVTLTRQLTVSTSTSVMVQAYVVGYKPDQIHDGLRQGDSRVEILNDEIAAAGWPGPPRDGDAITDTDGTVLQVAGAVASHDGSLLLGYTILARSPQ